MVRLRTAQHERAHLQLVPSDKFSQLLYFHFGSFAANPCLPADRSEMLAFLDHAGAHGNGGYGPIARLARNGHQCSCFPVLLIAHEKSVASERARVHGYVHLSHLHCLPGRNLVAPSQKCNRGRGRCSGSSKERMVATALHSVIVRMWPAVDETE